MSTKTTLIYADYYIFCQTSILKAPIQTKSVPVIIYFAENIIINAFSPSGSFSSIPSCINSSPVKV